MADRFELFHLSCFPKHQHDMFNPPVSREEWLRKIFSIEQPFEHHGSNFHYVPATDVDGGTAILGRVGRQVERPENKPPSEGLEEFTHLTWLAAVTVLDPTHHDDGQKFAIQDTTNVGKPSALVKRLAEAINQRYPNDPYTLKASQLIETQSFWDFVAQNKGKITSISFEFVPPNPWGSDDEFTEAMRKYRDEEHAKSVKLTLADSEGNINPDTENIRRTVRYAERNGGGIKARAKGNKNYNSRTDAKRTYLDEIVQTGTELVTVAGKLVNKILGRE